MNHMIDQNAVCTISGSATASTSRPPQGRDHQPLATETDTSPGPGIADPSTLSPETVYDREWALNVLERAFRVMKRECEQSGTLHEFETLKPWLTGERAGRPQADAARELGMNEGAARVAIHRLRRRFRDFFF